MLTREWNSIKLSTVATKREKGGQNHLSEKLRISLEAARVNAKMTQVQVCEALGISLTTLVKWEHGERMPTADKAVDMANLYGLRLDDINFCRKS